MATKKKTIPKTIKYRGLTLRYNKISGDYSDKLGGFCVRQHGIDSWSATVYIGSDGGPDEESSQCIVHAPMCMGDSYCLAKTYQEAIDLAVDNAVDALDAQIRWLTNDKEELLNIKKGK